MRLEILILEKYLKQALITFFVSNFIHFVCKKDKNYCLQMILKEWKYLVKEKKRIKYIADGVKFSSDESDESDEEYFKFKHLGI